MGTFVLRALRVTGAIVFWLWLGFQWGTTWIGRSTVPEDTEVAATRIAAFFDWLVATPWWVPASLASLLTLVALFPGAIWTAIQAMRGKIAVAPEAKAIEASPTVAAEPKPETEPLEYEPFGGGLLGGPIGGMPIGAVTGIRLPPAPPRTDPESEHEEKKAAKKAILKLTREYFEPALHAAGKFKCAARDVFLLQIERSSAARNLFSRAIDYGVAIDRDRKQITSYLDLQRIDKVREMNLDEVERGYLDNCGEYARNLVLAVSVINQAKGLLPDHVAAAKEKFEAWRALHAALARQHNEIGKEHLDLHTIGKPHWDFLKTIPEPDWAKITKPQS